MTKTSFLYILVHSFQFFQYYPDKETKSYTIVSYPEVERDYYEFLKEFEMRPLPETLNTSLSPELKDELQQMCEDVAQSAVFELILPKYKDSNLPPLQSSNFRPSTWSTDVKLLPLMLGEEEKLVPMYPCYMGDHSNDHFYLAYGFNEGYTFVFKEFTAESGLRVYGLVEPTPGIDPTYWNQRRLEKYFLHIHRTYQPKLRDFDPICSLNGYQQFRLCSVLENSRRSDDLKESSSDKFMYLDTRHQKRCEENLKVTFEKIDSKSPAYSRLHVKITAMSCHMKQGKFSFLVSHNPTDEESVFILSLRMNWATGEKEGRVLQHVNDIALLKYANDLY